MGRKNTGVFLVLAMFSALVVLTVFLVGIYLLNISNEIRRTRLLSQALALSSARVKAKAYERIKDRWDSTVIPNSIVSHNSLVIPKEKLTDLQRQLNELKSSLSGYQSRIKAVLTVLCEAHGISRDVYSIVDHGFLDLGLKTQSEMVTDLGGNPSMLNHLWLKRQWDVSSDSHASPATLTVVVDTSKINFGPILTRLGLANRIKQQSTVSLQSRLNHDLPFLKAGFNGGFPVLYQDAFFEGKFNPYRWPKYEVLLTATASDK